MAVILGEGKVYTQPVGEKWVVVWKKVAFILPVLMKYNLKKPETIKLEYAKQDTPIFCLLVCLF